MFVRGIVRCLVLGCTILLAGCVTQPIEMMVLADLYYDQGRYSEAESDLYEAVNLDPSDAESRGIVDNDWVAVASRSGETTLRASVTERVQPGVVYTTFHHPVSGANVITTDNSDWATNCPEYKVTAVEVAKVMQPSDWQREYGEFTARQRAFLPDGNDTTPVTESDTSA